MGGFPLLIVNVIQKASYGWPFGFWIPLHKRAANLNNLAPVYPESLPATLSRRKLGQLRRVAHKIG